MMPSLWLETDITVTFFPDAPDGEVIKTGRCEYTMCRLPNGVHAVKSITYFKGVNSMIGVGRAIRELSDPDNPCNRQTRDYLKVSIQKPKHGTS